MSKMLKKIFSKSLEESFFTHDRCYLGSVVHGKNIVKSLGLMSMVKKGIAGNINEEIESLLQKFVNSAEAKGSNAIINFRFDTGTYQQVGSSWIYTYLIIYGEGVVVS